MEDFAESPLMKVGIKQRKSSAFISIVLRSMQCCAYETGQGKEKTALPTYAPDNLREVDARVG